MMDDTSILRVADAVLADLLERPRIRSMLLEIRSDDPAAWDEIRRTIGQAAIRTMSEPPHDVPADGVVRARACAAVDPSGKWAIYGTSDLSVENAKDTVVELVDAGERYSTVVVDLPMPTLDEIQGGIEE